MIPGIENGVNKHFEQSIMLDSIDDAEDMFVIAKERLLHVNKWHQVAGGISAVFTLTDKQGNELHRHAHKGDYVRIKIPGPGNSTGGGYDWVRIESIRYDDYPDTSVEQLWLELRPTSSPLSNDDTTAHFFDGSASSIFIIERAHARLVASYYGVNEKANTETGSISEDVRNVIVSTTAIAGGSAMQWNALLKGFIELD
jgi:hypothetical protein